MSHSHHTQYYSHGGNSHPPAVVRRRQAEGKCFGCGRVIGDPASEWLYRIEGSVGGDAYCFDSASCIFQRLNRIEDRIELMLATLGVGQSTSDDRGSAE